MRGLRPRHPDSAHRAAVSVLLSPQDAARIYRKTVNHIYRMANYYGWRRITYRGRVYYDAQEVDDTLGEDSPTE